MTKLPPIDTDGEADKKKKAPKLSESNEKKRKPKEDEKVLRRLVSRFNRCVKHEAEPRKEEVEDRKFYAGDQWSATTKSDRAHDNRPCLTVNKLPTFVHQVTNDQRQNRPAINISPVGDRGDVDAAKMYRGVIRAIERNSSADIAYDTAYECAAISGRGYVRILTERESPLTFEKTLVIRRVRNPFTVYLDPDHQEPDGSDAKFGFVTELIPKDEFKERWPKAQIMPFDIAGAGENKNWIDAENIRVVEYYEITHDTKTLVALSNGWVGFKDEIGPEAQAQLDAGTWTIDREEESEIPSCKWYKATQIEILEETPWPGQYVPIAKVIGDEIDIEGKLKTWGLVRQSKDAQRMVNYWTTAEAEQLALAPKSPFIMEEGQVEGHEAQWKQANVRSYPYLLYKAVNVNGKPAPPPQRQPSIGVPAGVVQAKQGAAQDMMATTGVRFDATNQERTIDESGRALRELRRTADIGSFHYVDNLSRMLKHLGRMLLDLIPPVLDTKRVMVILREDDTEETITVDPNAPKSVVETKHPTTGKTQRTFNPTVGKYGVTVTIGPSYATKRIEAAESMMDFARALPNTATMIADLIARNQDWPGAEEMAKRLAKAVPPQLMTPDQKDMSPQIQAILQNMQHQIQTLMAERAQMLKALTDQNAERAIQQDRVNKDFEAKILAVMQKADAAHAKEVGGKVDQLIDSVTAVMDGLEQSTTQPTTSA